MKKLSYFLLLSMLPAISVFAHCMKSEYYGGGGVAINTMDRYDSSSGFQFLGGYCLKQNLGNPKIKTSVELGYLDAGTLNGENDDRSIAGVWGSGLVEYKSNHSIHFLARAGYDFGDDDGAMIGAGIAFNISKWSQIRTEYINRDETDSLQLNLITEF